MCGVKGNASGYFKQQIKFCYKQDLNWWGTDDAMVFSISLYNYISYSRVLKTE